MIQSHTTQKKERKETSIIKERGGGRCRGNCDSPSVVEEVVEDAAGDAAVGARDRALSLDMRTVEQGPRDAAGGAGATFPRLPRRLPRGGGAHGPVEWTATAAEGWREWGGGGGAAEGRRRRTARGRGWQARRGGGEGRRARVAAAASTGTAAPIWIGVARG